MKTVTSVKIASLLLGMGLLTGGTHLKAVTCDDIRAKENAKQVLTSQDVTQKGKCIEQAIGKWSGAAGDQFKSIFMSAADSNKRITNVFDGDNFMPAVATGTLTEARLGWTEDLRIAQSFLKKYAPDSASLKQAWNQIVAGNLLIQNTLTIANEKKNDPLTDKINLFAAIIPTLQEMQNSLTKEFGTVSGVRMWFYNTEASKGIILATIPVIKTALQRIITDFKLLQAKAGATGQNTTTLPSKDIEKLNREKQAYVPEILKIFANRNKEQANTPLKPSELKKLMLEKSKKVD